MTNLSPSDLQTAINKALYKKADSSNKSLIPLTITQTQCALFFRPEGDLLFNQLLKTDKNLALNYFPYMILYGLYKPHLGRVYKILDNVLSNFNVDELFVAPAHVKEAFSYNFTLKPSKNLLLDQLKTNDPHRNLNTNILIDFLYSHRYSPRDQNETISKTISDVFIANMFREQLNIYRNTQHSSKVLSMYTNLWENLMNENYHLRFFNLALGNSSDKYPHPNPVMFMDTLNSPISTNIANNNHPDLVCLDHSEFKLSNLIALQNAKKLLTVAVPETFIELFDNLALSSNSPYFKGNRYLFADSSMNILNKKIIDNYIKISQAHWVDQIQFAHNGLRLGLEQAFVSNNEKLINYAYENKALNSSIVKGTFNQMISLVENSHDGSFFNCNLDFKNPQTLLEDKFSYRHNSNAMNKISAILHISNAYFKNLHTFLKNKPPSFLENIYDTSDAPSTLRTTSLFPALLRGKEYINFLTTYPEMFQDIPSQDLLQRMTPADNDDLKLIIQTRQLENLAFLDYLKKNPNHSKKFSSDILNFNNSKTLQFNCLELNIESHKILSQTLNLFSGTNWQYVSNELNSSSLKNIEHTAPIIFKNLRSHYLQKDHTVLEQVKHILFEIIENFHPNLLKKYSLDQNQSIAECFSSINSAFLNIEMQPFIRELCLNEKLNNLQPNTESRKIKKAKI